MKTVINWHERAKQRKFCAAERWKEAMRDSFIDAEELSTTEILSRMRRREQEQNEHAQIHPRKSTAALLAKNPNHFKELAAKSHKKSRENKLSEDICKKN